MIYDRFLENTFVGLIEQTYKQLEQSYQKNIVKYKEIITSEIMRVLKNINETELSKNNQVSYIIFTLLRTKVLKKDYKYMVYLYDDYFYIKEGIEVGEIDVSFIMKQYEQFEEKLKAESKRYVGLLSNSIVKNIGMEYLDIFHKYVTEIIRKVITEITETEEYTSIGKSHMFQIYAGELLEPCEVIYKEVRKKTKNKVVKWLYEMENEQYPFADFKDMTLDTGYEFANLDLRYCDFRRSNLTNISMPASVLMGANFKDCKIENSNFFCTHISETNFENANLKNADFRFAICFTGRHDENRDRVVGYVETNFKNANLEGANFENATIIGANFIGANLKNTNFKDTALIKSKFTKVQVKDLNLTDEQLQNLIFET